MKFSRNKVIWSVEILLIGLFTLSLPITSFAQATICGYIFLDANQDGVKNPNELARANHLVYLDDLTLMMNGQGANFSTNTDADGHYCFLVNSIGGYGYWVRTDIPENSTFLTAPMLVDLKTGAMPPHLVQVTHANQKVSVNFGFYSQVAKETPIFCQSEEQDKSVCVHNHQFLMQVTPNNEATEVKNMAVEVVKDNRGKDAYIGDNNTSIVAVVEKDSSTRRLLRDGSSEDFVITVGKDLSDDGEEFSLDARINADGSVSFSEQDVPNVVATSTQDGFIVTDSESPTVSVEVANNGDITATDSDDPTMGLFINGSTGEVAVTDTEYPDTLAVINPNGSFDITDSQFPDLVATVYGDGYVIKDIKNDVVVKIDSQGNYTIIDNSNQVCIELPRTRGLGKWFKKQRKKLKNIISSVMRFIQKVVGFVGKIARFVARVAPVISKALRVVAVVARVAAVVFPMACKFFCAVAAFAEAAANIVDAVGQFAGRVADIAEAIQRGSLITGFWVGNNNPECNTRRGVQEGEEGGVILRGEVSTTVINAGISAGQALASQLLCRNDGNSNNNQTNEPPAKQTINIVFKGNGGNDGLVTSTPVGIRCEAGKSCSPKEVTGDITLTVVGKRFLSWGTGCAFPSGGSSRTCTLIADNKSKNIEVKFEGIRLPLEKNEIRGYESKIYRPWTNIFGDVRTKLDGSPKPHDGWDLVAPIGKNVYAIADGTLDDTRKGTAPCGGYGNCISIAFNFNGNNYFAFYAHLDEIKVKVGKVNKGDVIGTTGNTDAEFLDESEYHLHFEIRDKSLSKWTGDAIDPKIIYGDIPSYEPKR